MECTEYAVVDGQKGVFFAGGLVWGVTTLYQNKKYDVDVTGHLGIRRLYGNDVSNDLKCGRTIYTGFNAVRIEFSDEWSERDNGYSGEKCSASLSKSPVQCNGYFT